ncbi:MAG: hypothetical protein ACFE89_12995 [Candidatus Hodarchaeota archaeon]
MREANTVTCEEEALALVNQYGFVTLFPIKGTQFPNLYHAIKGTREEKFDKTWTWGYQLAQQKHLHYGKFIRKQVTLISLELLPYFLRLARDQKLGTAAQRILAHLQTHGKTSTTNLRKHLGYQQKDQKPEFLHAIDELQLAFAVAIVKRDPYPQYTNTYDLIDRWIPTPILEQAEHLTLETAREKLITQLLTNGVITTPVDAKRYIRF